MPIERCTLPNGKQGYRWGSQGKCYADGRDAAKQGLAITGSPEKFKQEMKSEKSGASLAFAKAALAEYEKLAKAEEANAFKSIASFLTKSGDMYGKENCSMDDEGADAVPTVKGGEENVSSEGETEASLDWKVGNNGSPPGDDFTCDDKGETVHDPQKPPATAGEDTYGKNGKSDNDGDEPDPVAKGDLDTPTEKVGSHTVVPPYNKDASPETNPAEGEPTDKYPVYTKDDTGPKTVADAITDTKEHEDILTKTESCEIEAFFTNAYISQEERDKVSEEDFAGPHRSFPIRDAHDVKSASKLVGHGANPTSIKRKIIQIAKRKGLEHALPDSWKGADQQSVASIYDQAIAMFSKLTSDEKNKLKSLMEV